MKNISFLRTTIITFLFIINCSFKYIAVSQRLEKKQEQYSIEENIKMSLQILESAKEQIKEIIGISKSHKLEPKWMSEKNESRFTSLFDKKNKKEDTTFYQKNTLQKTIVKGSQIKTETSYNSSEDSFIEIKTKIERKYATVNKNLKKIYEEKEQYEERKSNFQKNWRKKSNIIKDFSAIEDIRKDLTREESILTPSGLQQSRDVTLDADNKLDSFNKNVFEDINIDCSQGVQTNLDHHVQCDQDAVEPEEYGEEVNILIDIVSSDQSTPIANHVDSVLQNIQGIEPLTDKSLIVDQLTNSNTLIIDEVKKPVMQEEEILLNNKLIAKLIEEFIKESIEIFILNVMENFFHKKAHVFNNELQNFLEQIQFITNELQPVIRLQASEEISFPGEITSNMIKKQLKIIAEETLQEEKEQKEILKKKKKNKKKKEKKRIKELAKEEIMKNVQLDVKNRLNSTLSQYSLLNRPKCRLSKTINEILDADQKNGLILKTIKNEEWLMPEVEGLPKEEQTQKQIKQVDEIVATLLLQQSTKQEKLEKEEYSDSFSNLQEYSIATQSDSSNDNLYEYSIVTKSYTSDGNLFVLFLPVFNGDKTITEKKIQEITTSRGNPNLLQIEDWDSIYENPMDKWICYTVKSEKIINDILYLIKKYPIALLSVNEKGFLIFGDESKRKEEKKYITFHNNLKNLAEISESLLSYYMYYDTEYRKIFLLFQMHRGYAGKMKAKREELEKRSANRLTQIIKSVLEAPMGSIAIKEQLDKIEKDLQGNPELKEIVKITTLKDFTYRNVGQEELSDSQKIDMIIALFLSQKVKTLKELDTVQTLKNLIITEKLETKTDSTEESKQEIQSEAQSPQLTKKIIIKKYTHKNTTVYHYVPKIFQENSEEDWEEEDWREEENEKEENSPYTSSISFCSLKKNCSAISQINSLIAQEFDDEKNTITLRYFEDAKEPEAIIVQDEKYRSMYGEFIGIALQLDDYFMNSEFFDDNNYKIIIQLLSGYLNTKHTLKKQLEEVDSILAKRKTITKTSGEIERQSETLKSPNKIKIERTETSLENNYLQQRPNPLK